MKEIPEEKENLMRICGTKCAFPSDDPMNFAFHPIRSKEELDSAIIYSEAKSGHIKSVLKWNAMDDEWKNTLISNDVWWYKKEIADPKSSALREKLLSFGGEAVCMAYKDEDIDDILQYGQIWLGNNIKMMRGTPSHCHQNSCDLWEVNKERSRICTGYALSDDGMWRQHSWVIHIKSRSNQIIETTVPRIAYYGFVMNTEQCERFVSDNF